MITESWWPLSQVVGIVRGHKGREAPQEVKDGCWIA
jgi:hypothetical protein